MGRDLKNCREEYQLRKVFIIVSLLGLYGALVFIYPSIFFNLMPIFRSEVSFYAFLKRDRLRMD